MGENNQHIILIKGDPILEITDLTYDEESVNENIKNYISLLDSDEISFIIKISRIQALKLYGVWNWVIDNCPNKRVVHLIKHGKNDRIKYKNYRRACKLITKILVWGI